MNYLLKNSGAGLLIVFMLAILVAGCADKQDTAAEQTEAVKEAATETATEAVAALTTEEEALVARIAAIAVAIEEAPAGTAAILEKYSMTVEEYEAEIYRIASNPALSDAFEKAKNK